MGVSAIVCLPLIGFILYLFLAELFQKMEKNNGKELDTFKSVIKGSS